MKKIAVLASGRGTNLQALIDACKSGLIDAQICVVMSNNEDAKALERAQKEGIPTEVISNANTFRMIDALVTHGTDLVVLAGYLQKIAPSVIDAFKDQIINIHPSLLPKYGGEGMYGRKVHETVLANGETETGVTIHHVTENYDEGEIIEQLTIKIHDGDTPELLAARVLQYERMLLVHTVRRLVDQLDG